MIALLFVLFTSILTPQGVGNITVNGTVLDVEGPFSFEVVNNSTILIRPWPGIVYREKEGIIIRMVQDGKLVVMPAVVELKYSKVPGHVTVGNVSIQEGPTVVEVEMEENPVEEWVRIMAGLAIGLGLVYFFSQQFLKE